MLSIAVCVGLNWDLIMIVPQIPISGECLNAAKLEEFLSGKGCNTAIALYRLTHQNPAIEPIYAEGDSLIMKGGDLSIGKEPEIAFKGQPSTVEVRMIGSVGTDVTDNKRGMRMKSWPRRNWVKVDSHPGEGGRAQCNGVQYGRRRHPCKQGSDIP